MLHASTSEAAPRPEHRRRHQRKLVVDVKLYKEAMEKISTRLIYTKNCFKESMKLLNESKEHVNGNPKWLPKVNFVSIHHNNKGGVKTRYRVNTTRDNECLHAEIVQWSYRRGDARPRGGRARRFSASPRRPAGSGRPTVGALGNPNICRWADESVRIQFRLLAPKLYTHLMEYSVVFDLLMNVTSLSADDDYHEQIVRKKVLESIKIQLDSSITDVIDAMESVNMTPSSFDASQMQLSDFAKEVDKTKRYLQDRIAYRGYLNLLKNWLNEFKCWRKGRQGRMSATCATHRSMLIKRKEIKERKTRT
ncbi:hypothetical protein EVAR_9545_1 [Eumeta japonica]|uniref:Uncharacterized protein n=1 Tax=Eumeta variegata TaxID=151549 RepID=A0A4C1U4S1_EUMVA|nr:hypothetical protein EVAR_9545_1 [Eumeta japonica]